MITKHVERKGYLPNSGHFFEIWAHYCGEMSRPWGTTVLVSVTGAGRYSTGAASVDWKQPGREGWRNEQGYVNALVTGFESAMADFREDRRNVHVLDAADVAHLAGVIEEIAKTEYGIVLEPIGGINVTAAYEEMLRQRAQADVEGE